MSDQHTLEKRATASFALVLFMMMLLGVVVGILMLLSLFIDPEVPFEIYLVLALETFWA